jgi:NitT/TauT family transport system substrate-binding protein
MAAALQAGTADAAILSEPALTIAMERGDLRSLGDPNAAIDPKGFLIAAFCCSPAYAQRNPAVVARFTSVLYRVTAFTNAHHDATVSLIADYTHMTEDLVRKMTRQTIATSLDAGMIQPAIDLAAKYGFLERAFDAHELLA